MTTKQEKILNHIVELTRNINETKHASGIVLEVGVERLFTAQGRELEIFRDFKARLITYYKGEIDRLLAELCIANDELIDLIVKAK